MSSSISKKGLGRGLSSLMGDTKDVSIQNTEIENLKIIPSTVDLSVLNLNLLK